MSTYIINGISDAGTKNPVNQDASFAGTMNTANGEAAFVVVCDGMGGLESGEIASASIIEKMREWFYKKSELAENWEPDAYEVHKEWDEIVSDCNMSIIEYSVENGIKCGSTIVCGLLTAEGLILMNVGDSRAYRVSHEVKKLSMDHSVVGSEIASGLITEEEAKHDKRNNILTQCIGVVEEVNPYFINDKNSSGLFLFCSDGFYNRVSNDELFTFFNNGAIENCSLEKTIKEIVSIDRARGETDDITVIALMRLEK